MAATPLSRPETPLQGLGTVSSPAVGGASQNFPNSSIAKIQEVDFVAQFNENIAKLIQALGLTRNISLAQGSIIRRYDWDKTKKVDWSNGSVGEGALIPLSDAKLKEVDPIIVDLKKYRKQVTGELIQTVGQDLAINQTDQQLVLQIQKAIRKELFANISSKATTTAPIAGTVGLQGALATAKGTLDTVFEDYGAEQTVVLVNPIDIAKWLGTQAITTNTAFGMSYLVPFVGCTVLAFTDVPVGTVYATVAQNLILAHAAVNGVLGSTFGLTSDATGLVGVSHAIGLDHLAIDTVAITGMHILAEIPAGVLKIAIPEAPVSLP